MRSLDSSHRRREERERASPRLFSFRISHATSRRKNDPLSGLSFAQVCIFTHTSYTTSIPIRIQHSPRLLPSRRLIFPSSGPPRRLPLALGQSAPSFSPLGGVKPHTLDTYWAAAAAVARRQRAGERGQRRRVEWQEKWEKEVESQDGS